MKVVFPEAFLNWYGVNFYAFLNGFSYIWLFFEESFQKATQPCSSSPFTNRPAKSCGWGRPAGLTGLFQRPLSFESHGYDIAREENACMGNKFQRHGRNVEEREISPLYTIQVADHLVILEGHNSPAVTGLRSFLASAVS